MVCAWLMERQDRIAAEQLALGACDLAYLKGKQATAGWYLTHIVPEAIGLSASVEVGARYLYDLETEAL